MANQKYTIMKVNEANDLFANMIKSLHSAETKLEKELPGLAKKATDKELAKGFEAHVKVTQKQIERLEKIGEMMEFSPRGKKNVAMDGILEELKTEIKEIKQGELLDVDLIIGAQKVEHYEIAAYGSACAMAKLMKNDEVLNLLQETLKEEKEQDQLLTELAENSINVKAVE